nr:hypothetical protein [uncultured Chryseobacterium sp.]
MENPIAEAKRELIEWIQGINNFEEIQELLDLKNSQNVVVAESYPEYAVKNDFDERFSKGMSGEELMTRIYKHIESLPWKEK